jgi:predicted CXXCH cytochrome family protein
MRAKVLALAAGVLATAGEGAAFHEKGVANCNGCHVTHGGESSGALVGPSADRGMLIAESATDVCLVCHERRSGSVLGTDPLVPPPETGPGNFVFLTEDNLNDAPGGALRPILGDAAGHNVVAPGHGLRADPRYALAPGGTYPSSKLGCTSCHDPHGNTNFRMLYGAGPVMGGVATFGRAAPDAEGPTVGTGPESARHHTAYRSGMSDWCGNCHGQYHQAGSGSAFRHPVDRILSAEVVRRYAEYEGDAHPTAGVEAQAYLPAVPFEDRASTTISTSGPGPASRVMCLSCHRAHATSSPAAGRWDFKVGLLSDDGRASGSYPIPNPYGGSTQGPLCSKCHETPTGPAKDSPAGLPADFRPPIR